MLEYIEEIDNLNIYIMSFLCFLKFYRKGVRVLIFMVWVRIVIRWFRIWVSLLNKVWMNLVCLGILMFSSFLIVREKYCLLVIMEM